MAVDKSKVEKNKQAAGSKPIPANVAVEVPVLVKIFAVLEYIGAGVLLLFGIFMVIAAKFIGGLFLYDLIGDAAYVLITVCGVITIGLAVLEFFIGRGLWKGQNWARLMLIIFMCLGILWSILAIIFVSMSMSGAAQIMAFMQYFVSIVISGLIGYYLLFNQDVKKAFVK